MAKSNFNIDGNVVANNGTFTGNNNVIIGGNSGSTIASTNNNIIIADGAGTIVAQADSTKTMTFAGPVGLPSYVKTSLPSATAVGQMIYVSNATGAHNTGSLAFSSNIGTAHWIDVTTGNVVV